MRILMGTDGSRGSVAACDAIGSLPWAAGTTIRLVAVMDGRGRPTVRDSLDALGRGGVEVELRRGDPADELAAAAAAWAADLVVVGCRGWGPWATVPIGSVSAAVVDRAPCPVLVVRGPLLEPVVLATDGSEGAFRAELLLRRWPRTAGEAVEVVSVGRDELDEARLIATEVANRLAAFCVPAEAVVYRGDPGDGILQAARDLRAGLVVVGTRGLTGLTRLVLGSVARRVLTHARCSVLVVREAPARAGVRGVLSPAVGRAVRAAEPS